MEIIAQWYRNITLKKTFILMTISTILITVLLSILVMTGLNRVRMIYYQSIGFQDSYSYLDQEDAEIEFIVLEAEDEDMVGSFLTIALFASPLIVFLVVAALMSLLLYNTKLKKPLGQLKDGMDNIAGKNLDFQLDYRAEDELGRLCSAFEVMRRELLLSNRKMWRIFEERQNLNKAFSHDVRTPITIVKGHLQVLNKGLDKGDVEAETVRQTLDLSLNNLDKIDRYVQTMEEASSLQEIEPVYSDMRLGTVIDQMKMDLNAIDPTGKIHVMERLKNRHEVITADWQLVMRVLHNLVVNGLRFCETEVVIQCTQLDGWLQFSVTDDGPGFTKEAREMAFIPFYSTEKDSRQGLGLYICRILISRMSGKIEIDDNDPGARIYFRIPLHEQEEK